MALIVEDGTEVAGANSYASLTFANDYFSLRNDSAWTGSDSVKEAALIKATDYIELRFSKRFIGTVVTDTQPLSFPRTENEVDLGVPIALQKACVEYAKICLSSNLIVNPVQHEQGNNVTKTSIEIAGAIKEEVEYDLSVPISLVQYYPSAEMYLTGLLLYRNIGLIRS